MKLKIALILRYKHFQTDRCILFLVVVMGLFKEIKDTKIRKISACANVSRVNIQVCSDCWGVSKFLDAKQWKKKNKHGIFFT